MRTITSVRLVAALALIFTGTVAAQEWRDALPGEPLYEAKQRIETAELNAAVEPLEKASVHLQHADRRVEEMRRSAGRGNSESLDRLSEDYAAAMQQAEEHIGRARSQGRDTTQASQQVDRATKKHTEVLTSLLNQVPEQAIPAIRHAREVSLRGRQTALEQLRGNRAGRLERDGGIERDTGRDSRIPTVENLPRRPDTGGRGGFPERPGGGLPGGGNPPGR